MKTLSRWAYAPAVALFITTAVQAGPLRPALVRPDEVTWQPTLRGTQHAILVGDPHSAGIYVYQARFPAGFRNPPHVHSDERIVTILAGTLLVGYGEQFDEGKMKALPAGSTFTEPAGHSHFAWAKDMEVVVQVVGHGPSDTTWLRR